MDNPYQTPSAPGNASDQFATEGISHRTATIMGRTKGWVRFVGVTLIVFAVLLLVPIVVAFVTANAAMIGVGLTYLVFDLLALAIPGIKLNRYANRIDEVLRTGQARELETALNEHRGLWKYLGILQIIWLTLFLLGILGSLLLRG